ncbi:MAG: DNA-processing protein DprA [Clostridia bacterium]|nr:DNA-processing protein DprA [Clostridia bacterium]
MDYSREELMMIWLRFAPAGSWRAEDALVDQMGGVSALWDGFYGEEVRKALSGEAWTALEAIRRAGESLIVKKLDEIGANAVGMNGASYPRRLLSLSCPPKALFFKGTLPGDDVPAAAMIGARSDTRYGRQQAQKIARDLASAGVVIISGLARGIDTAAHLGALEGGGKTVAVLGNGISSVYPPENRELCRRIIASGGCVISEFPPDAAPLSYHFPIRNRIISALSDTVILIEARKKSGTASTIGHALDQGKEIFALPGNVDAPGSELPLTLLKEGAQMLTCAQDVLEAMGWMGIRQMSMFDKKDTLGKAPEGDVILEALFREDQTFEELLEITGLDASGLSARLTILEIEGRIQRIGGRAYTAVR